MPLEWSTTTSSPGAWWQHCRHPGFVPVLEAQQLFLICLCMSCSALWYNQAPQTSFNLHCTLWWLLAAGGADMDLQPNASAPLLRTSKARREWIEQEMELCSTSWQYQRVRIMQLQALYNTLQASLQSPYHWHFTLQVFQLMRWGTCAGNTQHSHHTIS
jgi:hypothetical protein